MVFVSFLLLSLNSSSLSRILLIVNGFVGLVVDFVMEVRWGYEGRWDWVFLLRLTLGVLNSFLLEWEERYLSTNCRERGLQRYLGVLELSYSNNSKKKNDCPDSSITPITRLFLSKMNTLTVA